MYMYMYMYVYIYIYIYILPEGRTSLTSLLQVHIRVDNSWQTAYIWVALLV